MCTSTHCHTMVTLSIGQCNLWILRNKMKLTTGLLTKCLLQNNDMPDKSDIRLIFYPFLWDMVPVWNDFGEFASRLTEFRYV